MVSLRGAPISMPSVATVGFSEFFQLGRVLRCHLPVAGGRVVHLVVVFGFQGASRLTEKLLDAVLCELAVVASGQPCLIVGDLNIEPERIPCLLKGLMAGDWFDLQSSWASASGVDPLPTCCRSFGSGGGSMRDFILGCPLAVSALRWCSVLQDRWILHHYAVRASFSVGRWSARVCLPACSLSFGLLPGLPVLISPGGLSLLRFVVFGMCMMSLLSLVRPTFWEGIRSSLMAGDISSAWSIWSFSAEVSFVRAFVGSGGPTPESGFGLGRGAAQFRYVSIGGPVVRKVRSDLGSGDGQAVHLFKDSSVSRVIILRRRLGSVLSVLDGIYRNGLTLSRDLEHSAQWDAVVSAGPCGPLCRANLDTSPAVGLSSFGDHVRVLHDVVVVFLHRVVVFRRDVAVRSWRSWMLEDDKVHPYRWLARDLVAPAPFLCCDPCLTVDGSGVLSDPDRIDEQFRNAWRPFFCRAGRSAADPSVFDREVGGWLPRLGEFDFPPLLGSDLYYVVQHKRVSAGGLDGWGWKES